MSITSSLSQRVIRRLCVGFWLCAAMMWAASPSAQAADRPNSQQTFEFVAFSTDSRLFALKVVDESIGNFFQVRKTKKNAVVASYVFNDDNEGKVWRKVKREHKLAQEPVKAQENPVKGFSLMTEVRGAKLRILVMRTDFLYDE